MKLPIFYYGSKILRTKSAQITEITPEVRKLAADMVETMHAHRALGLAANQIGQALAIFVSCVSPEGEVDHKYTRVFINPKYLWVSDERQLESEGCLSIPQCYLPVPRPMRLRVEATDLEGKQFQLELVGLGSANFCHEVDHLNGVLHIDRADPMDRRLIETRLRAISKAVKNGEQPDLTPKHRR